MNDSLNKTPDEIRQMHDTLRNSIRNYVSRVLEASNATEDTPLDCGATLDFGSQGLSILEMPIVESLFKDDDGSGMIWCNVDWTDEPVDFDSLYTEDQMNVISNL